ncbi:MAG: hypothetical protein WD794_05585 [Mycobacteriales bacterium]
MAAPTLTLRRPTRRKSLSYFKGSILEHPDNSDPAAVGAIVHVFFPGIPLQHWGAVAADALVEALDPAGVWYRIEQWHAGETTLSPTGPDLHLVDATLRCLGTMSADAATPGARPRQ